jgi:hypothetical protein
MSRRTRDNKNLSMNLINPKKSSAVQLTTDFYGTLKKAPNHLSPSLENSGHQTTRNLKQEGILTNELIRHNILNKKPDNS